MWTAKKQLLSDWIGPNGEKAKEKEQENIEAGS